MIGYSIVWCMLGVWLDCVGYCIGCWGVQCRVVMFGVVVLLILGVGVFVCCFE